MLKMILQTLKVIIFSVIYIREKKIMYFLVSLKFLFQTHNS